MNVPLPLESVRRGFTVPHKIKTQTFKTETITRKSGLTSDVEFSGIYGANRTVSIAIYDAYKKHRKLDYAPNTTRIEIRYHSARFSAAKTLNELSSLTGDDLFGSFRLLKPTKMPHLKGKEEIYKELLCLYREKHGLKEAISRIGQLDPKHGYTIVKKIVGIMEPYKIDLSKIFDRMMSAFVDAPISPEERRLIKYVHRLRRDQVGPTTATTTTYSSTDTTRREHAISLRGGK